MSWEPLQIDKRPLGDTEPLDTQFARYMAMREYGVAAACIGKPVELLTEYEKASIAIVAGCPARYDVAKEGAVAYVFAIKDLPRTEGVGFVVSFLDNGGMGQVVTLKVKEPK